MTFSDIHSQLFLQQRQVTYNSLITKNKQHTVLCTIPKDIQNESDKILVYDIINETYIDIEVSTVTDIT
jgi:hypothetical protein